MEHGVQGTALVQMYNALAFELRCVSVLQWLQWLFGSCHVLVWSARSSVRRSHSTNLGRGCIVIVQLAGSPSIIPPIPCRCYADSRWACALSYHREANVIKIVTIGPHKLQTWLLQHAI